MADKSPFPCQLEAALSALTQEHRQPESAPPSFVFAFSRILFHFQPFLLSQFSTSPAKKLLSHVPLPSILQTPYFSFFFPASLLLPKKRQLSSVFLASFFLLSCLFLAFQAFTHSIVSSFPRKLLPAPLLLVQGRCHHFQPPLWQVMSFPHIHAVCSWK